MYLRQLMMKISFLRENLFDNFLCNLSNISLELHKYLECIRTTIYNEMSKFS